MKKNQSAKHVYFFRIYDLKWYDKFKAAVKDSEYSTMRQFLVAAINEKMNGGK